MQTKYCVALVVLLGLCACVIIIIEVVTADDGFSNNSGHLLHKQMVQATMNWRTAKLHGLGGRIPIVTVNTRSDEPFLPMLGVQGISLCNVGVHGEWVSMLSKNAMLLDWFDDQLPKYRDELVIVVDAVDVLYGGCEIDKLLTAYRRVSTASGGAMVVVSAELPKAELARHKKEDPKHPAADRYGELREHRTKMLKAFGLGDDPWNGTNTSRSRCVSVNGSSCAYEFLDYGFMMGTVGALHELLTFVVKTVPPSFYEHMQGFLDRKKHVQELNDQDVAAMYMFDNPGVVTLDYAMGITASLHGMPKNLLEVRKKDHVWNTVTNAEQCFVHFNGDSPPPGDVTTHFNLPFAESDSDEHNAVNGGEEQAEAANYRKGFGRKFGQETSAEVSKSGGASAQNVK